MLYKAEEQDSNSLDNVKERFPVFSDESKPFNTMFIPFGYTYFEDHRKAVTNVFGHGSHSEVEVRPLTSEQPITSYFIQGEGGEINSISHTQYVASKYR